MHTKTYTPTVWNHDHIVVHESNAGHIAFVAGGWAAIMPPISRNDRGIAGTLLASLWNAASWISDYIAGDPDERLAPAGEVTEWTIIAERSLATITIYPTAMGRSASIFAFGQEGTRR